MSLLTCSDNPSIGDAPINAVMVIAIDFGTTFSGYAFAFKTNKEDIRTHTAWGNCVGIPVSFKAPTCVLTDKNDRFVSFGYEAQNRYSSMTPEEAADFHYFEHFKMDLHDKKLERSLKISSTDGHCCLAIDIFAMALRFLKEHVLKTLKTQTGSIPGADTIQWVVTVPAIWTDASKQFMREASHKGGLISSPSSHQLIIALEPEAASLYCRKLESGDMKMKPGTKYLVLDCGGGTLDITAHELMQDLKLSELYQATGGNLGGTQVDYQFVQLLKKVFGKHVIEQFHSENPADWLQLMINFERAKRGLNPQDKSQPLNIPLSYEFVSCYQTLTGKNIKSLSHRGMCFASGMLRMPYDAMESLFNPVVSGIVRHVQDLLKKSVLSNVSCILLVGGFGESLILQDSLKKIMNHRAKMLVPPEPSLCVMKGAVLFGFNPRSIAERIARKTYGRTVYETYTPNKHPDPNKTSMREGKKYAFPAFQKFITKGETIQTGAKRTFGTHPTLSNQKTLSVIIYQTDKADPIYSDEEGMSKLGSIEVALPGEGLQRKVEVTITVGSTELEVEVKDLREGGDCKTCSVDFLSH